MIIGPIEARYEAIMNALMDKLNNDPRIVQLLPRISIQRGSPIDEPHGYPVMHVLEGQITNVTWDTNDVLATILVDLEVNVKSRNSVDGTADIKHRSLKIMDCLIGSINDRLLVTNGVALANGQNNLEVTNCDFGYFAPDDDLNIIYKAIIQLAINVEVPLFSTFDGTNFV